MSYRGGLGRGRALVRCSVKIKTDTKITSHTSFCFHEHDNNNRLNSHCWWSPDVLVWLDYRLFTGPTSSTRQDTSHPLVLCPFAHSVFCIKMLKVEHRHKKYYFKRLRSICKSSSWCLWLCDSVSLWVCDSVILWLFNPVDLSQLHIYTSGSSHRGDDPIRFFSTLLHKFAYECRNTGVPEAVVRC